MQKKLQFLIGTGLPVRWRINVLELYKTFDEFFSNDVLYEPKVQYIADNHQLYPDYATLVRVKNKRIACKRDIIAYESVGNGEYYARLLESTLLDNLGFSIEDIEQMIKNTPKTFLNQN